MDYRANTFYNEPRQNDLMRTLAVSFAMNRNINLIAGNNFAGDSRADVCAAISAQLPIIREEIKEALKALLFPEQSKPHDLADGLADIIVTVDGLRFRAGLNLDHVSGGVHSVLNSTTFELSGLAANARRHAESFFSDMFHMQFKAKGDYDSGHVEENWAVIDALHEALDLLETMIEVFSSGHTLFVPSGHFNNLEYALEVMCASLYNVCEVVANQFALNLGFGQHLVYLSNLSKFDTNEAVAQQGIEKYRRLGIDVGIFPSVVNGVKYFVIKSARDQHVGGKHYPQGKFLKSVFFKEPNWEHEPKPYRAYTTDLRVIDLSSISMYDTGHAFPVKLVHDWTCRKCGAQQFTEIEASLAGNRYTPVHCHCGETYPKTSSLTDVTNRTGIDVGDTVRAY